MELKVFSPEKAEVGKKKLPQQFSELVRLDVIKRAVEAIDSNNRQPYGANPRAGLNVSADVSRRRRAYRGSYGRGISRVPRKVMSRSGTQFNWVGAQAPGTVGGRRAHPAKAEKIWSVKINDKERKKAIRSALAATVKKDIVAERGHNVPEGYPFLISADFEKIDKAKNFKQALEKLGLKEELGRSSKKTVRAGKGKSRGRKYRKRTGPLIVVSGKCSLLKAGTNLPGVDIVEVNKLNAKLLAPGSTLGRLTLLTDGAIEKLSKEKLFI